MKKDPMMNPQMPISGRPSRGKKPYAGEGGRGALLGGPPHDARHDGTEQPPMVVNHSVTHHAANDVPDGSYEAQRDVCPQPRVEPVEREQFLPVHGREADAADRVEEGGEVLITGVIQTDRACMRRNVFLLTVIIQQRVRLGRPFEGR